METNLLEPGEPTCQLCGKSAPQLLPAAFVRASIVNLVAVAPTPKTLTGRQAAAGRFMPGTTRTLLDMVEDQLRAYLGGIVERFQNEGV